MKSSMAFAIHRHTCDDSCKATKATSTHIRAVCDTVEKGRKEMKLWRYFTRRLTFMKAEAAVADDALAASSIDPDPDPDKEVSAFQDTKLSIIPTDNTFNSKQ
jgi:hypothetical protein